jgi:hypothetical protein
MAMGLDKTSMKYANYLIEYKPALTVGVLAPVK